MKGVFVEVPWEPDEDILVREHYPTMDLNMLEKLLTKNCRTIVAIRSRAIKLGVKRVRTKKSSEHKILASKKLRY